MAMFRFSCWGSTRTQQKLIPECWDLKAVMSIGSYNGGKWLAQGSNAGVDFLLSTEVQEYVYPILYMATGD